MNNTKQIFRQGFQKDRLSTVKRLIEIYGDGRGAIISELPLSTRWCGWSLYYIIRNY